MKTGLPLKTTIAMTLVLLRAAWTLNPSCSIGCKIPVLAWTPRMPSLSSRSLRNSWDKGVFSALSMSLTDIVQDYMSIPDKSILSAVEKAGYRALPQDIAELAGVNLATAQAGLQSLSVLAGGDLEVSEDGSLVFNFPRDFRIKLATKSTAGKAKAKFEKAWPIIFWCTRITFGVFLISSIALVFSTIFMLLSTQQRSSEENDRRRPESDFRYRHRGTAFGGGNNFFNVYLGPDPFSVFCYRPYYGYYSMPLNQRPTNPQTQGFIESVFSYVFGDGDQQKDRDKNRLKLIASVIRKNGGAIISEQLAPYLDAPSPDISRMASNIVDEKFVLPVVTALKGIPKVTLDGDIVYIFPELQKSATADSNGGWGGIFSNPMQVASSSLTSLQNLLKSDNCNAILQYVKEPPFTFSVCSKQNLILSGSLGVLNLFGCLYLGVLFNRLSLGQSGIILAGLPGVMQVAYPFLLTYAVVFNVTPAIRAFKIKLANAKLEKLNESREEWASLLTSGGESTLIRKLKSAKKFAKDLRLLDTRDMIYTTAKPLTEQYDSKDDPALAAFDRI
eukprot:460185_1